MLKLKYRIGEKVVSIKKSVIYYKSVYYALLFVIFGVFGYIFLDSGFNTKTRVKVEYEDSSEVFYKVNYLDNNYDSNNDRYIASMVDTIDFTYNYKNLISEYISGYYRYSVSAHLITYENDETDSLWEREYILNEENTVVIDANNINSININDTFTVDFTKYRDEIYEFMNNPDINIELSGYLQVRINIFETLNFNSLDNEYLDNKVITINIPLTDDIFKIDVNDIDSMNSCYEFTSDKAMNIVFLIIGTFCVSVSLALLILVIRQFKVIYSIQSEYSRELKKILSKYNDCIVRIKRFYVNKKYNLIYVDSFDELMDVYEKKNKMISFKETKRGSESIFVIIDEDDAWIYKLQ